MTAGPAPANIASAFSAAAERSPERAAVIVLKNGEPRRHAFAELADDCDRIARGLESVGVGRGTRAALMVKPGPEFFAISFALFKLGAAPVLIDPGLGRRGLGRCLEEAAPEAFIGIPAAHLARLVLGWGRGTIRTSVVLGPRLMPGMHSLADVRAAGSGGPLKAASTSSDETAAILFTSGSTGAPKGAVYTHGNFIAQLGFLRDHFGIQPGEVDLPTFPLFALFDAALGMTAVVPEMDFTRPASVEPENILGPIRRHGVTHLFGSPALLDRVGRRAEAEGARLPSLKRVVSAGAPVSARIVERFSKLLAPGVQVHTPYGATEALPVASIASGELLGEPRRLAAEGKGTCVGRPIAGVEAKVIRISDAPIPSWSQGLAAAPGEVGEIVVRGPNVVREYFRRPEANALAKIGAEAGAALHRMGDLGYFDEAGRLWFCGRKSQRVATREGTMFTVCCEGVFNQHPKVRRSALVGVGRPPEQRPALVVELDEGAKASRELAEEILELGARFAHTRGIRDILFHPSLPVDIRHNAKISRETLARWAAKKLA